MSEPETFANARLVLRDEVVHGSIRVEGGRITALDQGSSVPAGAVDCDGDFLCPGLIELHTDTLERHLRPRPGVHWPHLPAIAAHDAELASVGITTVYDAIRVGSISDRATRHYGKYAREIADQIAQMRRAGAFKITHHLHLRAEICSETLPEELAEFGPEDDIGILSLMDHTPGQRQFRDISKFEEYVCGKHNMPKAEFDPYCAFLIDLRARVGAAHEAAAINAAQRFGATLASHDDTTRAQVATSRDQGIRLAEFPTTIEAAEACREAGIAIIMGGPNLVRGGSHSGNVAAMDLAKRGLLDILSSDYVPSSLLLGAVMLGQAWGDMARGIGTVTHAPAEAAGLTDRATLAIGQRADLLRFRLMGDVPVPRGVWVDGHKVA